MDAVVTDSIQHARQCVQHLKVALTSDHLKVALWLFNIAIENGHV